MKYWNSKIVTGCEYVEKMFFRGEYKLQKMNKHRKTMECNQSLKKLHSYQYNVPLHENHSFFCMNQCVNMYILSPSWYLHWKIKGEEAIEFERMHWIARVRTKIQKKVAHYGALGEFYRATVRRSAPCRFFWKHCENSRNSLR